MSSNTTILDNSITKKKCQRFTPQNAVEEMLAMAEYAAGNGIFDKKVLEHSFGSGNVLSAIVEEYILDGINQGMTTESISDSLSRNIYGFELDRKLYFETIKRINTILERYKIPEVKWNLFNADALYWENDVRFDFIIGNPPYVTYSEIDNNNQKALRERYVSCAKGKFDYCYAFIEFSLNMLSENGRLVQLVPNSIYKNVYANSLRELLKQHIKQINIYPAQKLFRDVLTSVSIFLYDEQYNGNYIVCENKTEQSKYNVSRKELGDKWILKKNIFSKELIRFGDYFKTSNAVATLRNEAFLVSEDQVASLEKDIVRPAASPKTMRYNKKQFIIFPYQTDGNGFGRYSEEAFSQKFPRAKDYLTTFKTELDKRKADEHSKWFEFGRSQALQHINQKKLLLSTVVTDYVTAYCIDEKTVPYAGIFIVPKTDKYDLETAKRILTSEDFLSYVQQIGIHVNGSSIRITCNDINNYMFPKGEFYGRAEL